MNDISNPEQAVEIRASVGVSEQKEGSRYRNVLQFPPVKGIRRSYLIHTSIYLDRNTHKWMARLIYRGTVHEQEFSTREDAMFYLGTVLEKLSVVEAI